jgi:hypothetical protein
VASFEDWRPRLGAVASKFVMNSHNEAALLCFSRAAVGDKCASNSGGNSLDGENASPTCPSPLANPAWKQWTETHV